MIENTNWSSPNTNIIAAFLDLRRALQSGYNAVLIKARNEDCMHPIRVKTADNDFRNYEFSSGHPSSVNKIKSDTHMSEFMKHLTLNYVTKYGTQEAVKKYYETGILSADNDKGMGRSHLVHIDDYIKFLEDSRDSRANMYRRQYRAPEYVNDTSHLFDFYRYKHGSPYAIKTFKRKLWVVKLIDKDPKVNVPLAVKVLNVVMTPLKFIPKKSVLRMPDYKVITFRIGGVTSGYSVDIQIPKKFSFNN
jgi:hypothetical protein